MSNIKWDEFDNNFATTLDGSITSSATVINLNDVPTNATKGYLAIDADESALIEYIYFQSKGAGFVTCPSSGGRGQGGTTAIAHDDGATVKMYWIAEHAEQLKEDVDENTAKVANVEEGWVETCEDATKYFLYHSWDATVKTAVLKTDGGFSSPDMTGMQVGDKVTFNQPTGGAKYGIVTALPTDVSYKYVTIFMYDTTVLNNQNATEFKFSHQKNPYGFDSNPSKWQVQFKDTANSAATTVAANTWVNLDSTKLDIPVGSFDVSYSVQATQVYTTSTTTGQVRVTLSTANNSESDSEMTSTNELFTANAHSRTYINTFRKKIITVTAKTSYYLNFRSSSAGTGYFIGLNTPTIIRATIAYL